MEISINDINTYQLPNNCFQSHYKIIEYLGEGSFGKVFKAREISTGRILAVKRMSINHSEKKYSNIIKEINLLKHLSHQNIVKYYDYFEEEDFIYLMMEYLEGGTLKDYINNKKEITEDEARIIIKQLLVALSYLHYTCDICHRDVKPENIMFKNKNDINELKLLDFGLSSDSFESKNYLENCGTLIYMAPEQIDKMIYSKGVDVWSVGIILYMLLNKGKNPFYKRGESREIIIKNISNDNIIFSNDCPISHMGKHLIHKLLKKNPSYRYTIRSALEHPWITMNKFDKIPMTIYDKAFVDEYAEKLKTLLLTAIFFSFQKKNNLAVSKNNNNKNSKISIQSYNKTKKKSNSYLNDYFYFNENKNIPKRKNSENRLKIFNMKEYEEMVKNSNILYKQKFKEDREIMFNPQLNINNNNELLLSALMKKIAEKQKTRQSSFLLETKTNIISNNHKYESINSLENSFMREQNHRINKIKNKSIKKNSNYVDEQKNPELDYEQNLSKLKTPYKLKNRNLISVKSCKSKLMRRFSAMQKMPKNSLNRIKNEKNKMQLCCKGNETNGRKLQSQNSPIKNYIDCSKKEIENKTKNDVDIYKNQLGFKKRKIKNKSVKNTNVFFNLDRSTFIDNKDKKWKMMSKNNKDPKNFPFIHKKEKVEKNLLEHIFNNNEKKEMAFLNNEKNNKLFSFTEQSQKIQPNHLFNKRLPKLFFSKNKINNYES